VNRAISGYVELADGHNCGAAAISLVLTELDRREIIARNGAARVTRLGRELINL